MKELKEIKFKIKDMVKHNKYYSKQVVLDASFKHAEHIIKEIKKGIFKKNIFRYGNLKLAGNIARFTLPEDITCVFDCKDCYAKKMPYDSIKIYRLTNLIIIMYALQDKEFGYILRNYIRKELLKHYKVCTDKGKLPIVRFHDSGDIFNVGYLNYIFTIVIQNPEIYFYTYTKNTKVFDKYLKMKKELNVTNFNIVYSHIIDHTNYFDFLNNFDNEFKKLQKIITNFRAMNTPLFFCNYNFEKLKERNKDNYNKLIDFFNKNKEIISYYKEHIDCGNCVACSAGNYRFVAFLKH